MSDVPAAIRLADRQRLVVAPGSLEDAGPHRSIAARARAEPLGRSRSARASAKRWNVARAFARASKASPSFGRLAHQLVRESRRRVRSRRCCPRNWPRCVSRSAMRARCATLERACASARRSSPAICAVEVAERRCAASVVRSSASDAATSTRRRRHALRVLGHGGRAPTTETAQQDQGDRAAGRRMCASVRRVEERERGQRRRAVGVDRDAVGDAGERADRRAPSRSRRSVSSSGVRPPQSLLVMPTALASTARYCWHVPEPVLT